MSTQNRKTDMNDDPAASAASAPVPAPARAKEKRGARAKKPTKTPAKTRRAARTTKTKSERAPGVIDTLVQYLEGGGGTVDQLVAKLARKFPDRDPGWRRSPRSLSSAPRSQLSSGATSSMASHGCGAAGRGSRSVIPASRPRG